MESQLLDDRRTYAYYVANLRRKACYCWNPHRRLSILHHTVLNVVQRTGAVKSAETVKHAVRMRRQTLAPWRCIAHLAGYADDGNGKSLLLTSRKGIIGVLEMAS